MSGTPLTESWDRGHAVDGHYPLAFASTTALAKWLRQTERGEIRHHRGKTTGSSSPAWKGRQLSVPPAAAKRMPLPARQDAEAGRTVRRSGAATNMASFRLDLLRAAGDDKAQDPGWRRRCEARCYRENARRHFPEVEIMPARATFPCYRLMDIGGILMREPCCPSLIMAKNVIAGAGPPEWEARDATETSPRHAERQIEASKR